MSNLSDILCLDDFEAPVRRFLVLTSTRGMNSYSLNAERLPASDALVSTPPEM